MLPLGSSAFTTALLAGCGGGDDAAAATPAVTVTSASFTGMAAPTLAAPAAMATTSVGSSLNVVFSDGSKKSLALAYHPFFATGDLVPNGNGGTLLAGGYVDIHNQPIIDHSVAGKERQFFSDSPDGTSLLTLPNPTVAGHQGQGGVRGGAVRIHHAGPGAVPAPTACCRRRSRCSRSTRTRPPARSRW